MSTGLRVHRPSERNGVRAPFHAQLRILSPVSEPYARCTHISMGGIRATAATALAPNVDVEVEFRLPGGQLFTSGGHIAWSHETLRLPLFGRTEGQDDDAVFGVAFEPASPDALLPIARLLASKDAERHRARRIRRFYGGPHLI